MGLTTLGRYCKIEPPGDWSGGWERASGEPGGHQCEEIPSETGEILEKGVPGGGE